MFDEVTKEQIVEVVGRTLVYNLLGRVNAVASSPRNPVDNPADIVRVVHRLLGLCLEHEEGNITLEQFKVLMETVNVQN